MSTDPYKVLGVGKTATADEIKKAYRKIARTSHPDLNPSDAKAEALFKAAGTAFDLLQDPQTRARYDRGEIDASGAEKQPHRQQYRDYAETAGNPYRRSTQGSGHFGGGFNSTADIFEDFFRQQGRGGADPRGQGFDTRGRDHRLTLDVSFMDAALGGSTGVRMPNGTSLNVKIPEGTADGQTIRLRGKGETGFGNGPTGDALITVKVGQHPHFSRDGNDILVELPITIDEAVLGGKIATPTIHGSVNLNIPKGSSSGKVLRLKGRGIRTKNGEGDQITTLKIVMPEQVDESLTVFMTQWRKTHSYNPRKGMAS